MDVAIRELKAKLSAYVQRAAAGEQITVTDRGRPVAVLGPLIGRVDLSAGIGEGWVQPARSTGLVPVKRRVGKQPVMDVLGEDRSE